MLNSAFPRAVADRAACAWRRLYVLAGVRECEKLDAVVSEWSANDGKTAVNQSASDLLLRGIVLALTSVQTSMLLNCSSSVPLKK